GRTGMVGAFGAVEAGDQLALQQVVEGGGLHIVPFLGGGRGGGGGDGPAVLAVVHLVPPAVQHGQVQPAVHGHLHPGGAAGLEGAQRVVQPDVAAGHQGGGHLDVVV